LQKNAYIEAQYGKNQDRYSMLPYFLDTPFSGHFNFTILYFVKTKQIRTTRKVKWLYSDLNVDGSKTENALPLIFLQPRKKESQQKDYRELRIENNKYSCKSNFLQYHQVMSAIPKDLLNKAKLSDPIRKERNKETNKNKTIFKEEAPVTRKWFSGWSSMRIKSIIT